MDTQDRNTRPGQQNQIEGRHQAEQIRPDGAAAQQVSLTPQILGRIVTLKGGPAVDWTAAGLNINRRVWAEGPAQAITSSELALLNVAELERIVEHVRSEQTARVNDLALRVARFATAIEAILQQLGEVMPEPDHQTPEGLSNAMADTVRRVASVVAELMLRRANTAATGDDAIDALSYAATAAGAREGAAGNAASGWSAATSNRARTTLGDVSMAVNEQRALAERRRAAIEELLATIERLQDSTTGTGVQWVDVSRDTLERMRRLVKTLPY